MRVYISGPMTGREDHNFPAFHRAAQRWREAGHEVVNPAESFDGRQDLPRDVYLRHDVTTLAKDGIEAIALLEEWETSRGAILEVLCGMEFGMDFFDAESMDPIRIAVRVDALQLPMEAGVV